ncbi:MAG: translocation/assembly module TamB domain-containing protein, partial [Pseudomonadota bacterium]
ESLTGGGLALTTQLATGPEKVVVNALSFATANKSISLTGDANLVFDDTLEADFDLQVPEPDVVLDALENGLGERLSVPQALTAVARLNADVAAKTASLSVDAETATASLDELALTDIGLRATYEGTAEAGAGQAGLTFNADGKAQQATALYEARPDDAIYRLTDLIIDAFGVSGKGRGEARLNENRIRGDLDLDAADLTTLNPLLGLIDPSLAFTSGSLTARVTGGQGAGGGQQVDAEVQGGSIDLKQAGEPLLGADQVGFALEGIVPRAGPQSKAGRLSYDLEADDVIFPGSRIGSVEAKGSGPLTALPLDLSVRGLRTPAVPASDGAVDVVAVLDIAGTDRTVDLRTVRLDFEDHRIRLVDAATLSLSPQGVKTTPLTLEIRAKDENLTGRVTVEAETGPSLVDATGTIDGLPLGVLSLVSPDFPMGGLADGRFAYRVGRGPDAADVALTITDFISKSVLSQNPKAIDLALEGGWTGRQAELDLTVTRLTAEPGLVTVRVPVTRGPQSLVPTLQDNAALDGRIDLKGSVADLMAFYPQTDHVASGNLVLDFTLSGTVDSPKLSGEARLSDGRYENQNAGLLLTDLALNTQLDDSDRLTFSVDGKDGETGSIRGEGEVLLDQSAKFPLKVSIDLADAVLIRRDDLTARASAETTAEGDLGGLSVTGDILVQALEFRIPDGVPPSVVTIPITVEGEETGTGEGAGAPEGSDVPIDLDVTVRIPGRAFVRGRGLESEWQGDLSVRGTAARPEVLGDLSTVRGTFDFAGRSFLIERGAIGFDGLVPPDPRLDVEMRTEVEDIEAILLVTGRATSPDLSVTSEPSRPSDSVLALVLFGKDISELNTFEVVRLANAVRSLQSGGGFDAVGSVRRSLGVDQLELDLGGGGESAGGLDSASVKLGKYVTDTIFVGVKRGIRSGESAVAVEVDVTDSITMETEVNQQSDSSIGFNWKWEY